MVDGGFLWDDWENAATTEYEYQRRFLGPLDVRHFISHPGLAILIPVPHLVFGSAFAPHLALAVALGVLTSLSLYALLRELEFERTPSAAIAALALLFPWSDSARMWATASLNNVAVSLFLVGAVLGLRALRTEGPAARRLERLSVAMYVLSVLTYEVAAVACLAAGLLYLLRAPRPAALRRWRLDLLWVGAALLYAGLASTKETQPLSTVLSHAADIADQSLTLLARAVVPFGDAPPLAVAASLALVVAGAIALERRLPDADARRSELRRWLLAAAGSAIAIVAGYALFVPAESEYVPLAPGILNRTNIVAGLGWAALVYSLAALAAASVLAGGRRTFALRVPLTVVLTAAVATGWSVKLADDKRDYARAADLQRPVLEALRRSFPHAPERAGVFTFGHAREAAPRVPVFNQSWDLYAAAKLALRSASVKSYPIRPSATLGCGPHSVEPRDREFGKTEPFTYGQLWFLDVRSGRSVRVRSEADCRSAAARLGGRAS